MPDGISIPGGPVFIGFPQPPDVPCDPTGDGWRGPPGPAGPQGVSGMDGGALSGLVNVLEHGAAGDGVTDDTAAIQSALNTYAGKATVFVPDTGQPYMCNQLNLPSNTDLLLYGTLKAVPGMTSSFVTLTNVSNVVIRGYGTIDGNKAAQTHSEAGLSGLGTINASRVRISGITLTNAFYWNLNVTVSDDVVVDGVTITGGGAANEFAAGSSNCWLTNCMIDGTNMGDYAFCFYGGVTSSGAIGNVVKNAGVGTGQQPPGIGILSDEGQSAPCSNIVIANNIIHDCGAGGVSCINVAGGIQKGIIISNNRSYNNCNTGYVAGNVGDIYLDQSTDVTIIGNQISANGNSSGHPFAGIFLGPTASHVRVHANQIYNIGQGTTTGAGMWNDGASFVYTSDNYIYDDQTTHTMSNAMIGGAGTNNVYINDHSDLPFSVTPASDTVATYASSAGMSFTHGRLNVGASPVGYTNTAGLPRWYAGNSGSAEGTPGTNIGADFTIVGVNDAGSALIAPPAFTIKRSSGAVTLAVAPTIATLPTNAATDAAAAAAGVLVGGMYRSGSTLMIRAI
jgi:hypothetical protein